MAVGLFALVFYIFHTLSLHLTETDMRQLYIVLATAVVSGAFCGGSVAFYYNTTKGSDAKDKVIADQAAGKDDK